MVQLPSYDEAVHDEGERSQRQLVVDNIVHLNPALNRSEVVLVVPKAVGAKALLMRLAGVGSLEDADALRGYKLCVPREALPDLKEGEYYHADLIGLEAFDGTESIGQVVEVVDYPAAECLKIQRPGGFLEVPMLPRWLDRVDIARGKVHLKDLDDIPLQKRR